MFLNNVVLYPARIGINNGKKNHIYRDIIITIAPAIILKKYIG